MCVSCGAGEYAETTEAARFCTSSCRAGRYGADKSCELCPEGKIRDEVGATSEDECVSCGDGERGASESSPDRTRCACTAGWGGKDNIFTGRIGDGPTIRLRDRHGQRPLFHNDEVEGRLEVKPKKTHASEWGTILKKDFWEKNDTLVACTQLGNVFGYSLLSSAILSPEKVQEGIGKIWWSKVRCNGKEETLEDCWKESQTGNDEHYLDVGIRCKFVWSGDCEECPAGKFSTMFGDDPCTSCDAGRYSGVQGATTSDVCDACSKGKYSEKGSATCSDCASGRYSKIAEATSIDSCQPCKSDEGSNAGSSSCIQCAAGTFLSSEGSCQNCTAGRYSDVLGATSENVCLMCATGKISTESSVSCMRCPKGSTTLGAKGKDYCTRCDQGLVSDDGKSCLVRICKSYQYNNNGVCADCDNTISACLMIGSFITFGLAAWYSTFIASDRKKMMRLKIVSTFFQLAELTTLVSVTWPSIVSYTIPFQFPISDAKCLAASSGWNQLHTFFAYTYGPMIVLLVPLINASSAPSHSLERKKMASMLTVLLSLWYSPLLQTIASMYDCYADDERGGKIYLVDDPVVSCEPSKIRTIVNMHSIVLTVLVGFGFPIISFLKVRGIWSEERSDEGQRILAAFSARR